MAIYSLGDVIVGTLSGAAAWEIRTASTNRARLLKMSYGVTVSPAVAYAQGIGRPAAIGASVVSSATFIAENPADPVSTVVGATEWLTGPTVPANFFARSRQGTGGTFRQIWSFPGGLVIGVSSSVVLWNFNALGEIPEVYAEVDE